MSRSSSVRGGEGPGDAADDHAIGAAFDERAPGFVLGQGRAISVGDEHGIAERVGGPLDPDRELGIEGVGAVGPTMPTALLARALSERAIALGW